MSYYVSGDHFTEQFTMNTATLHASDVNFTGQADLRSKADSPHSPATGASAVILLPAQELTCEMVRSGPILIGWRRSFATSTGGDLRVHERLRGRRHPSSSKSRVPRIFKPKVAGSSPAGATKLSAGR